LHIEDVASRNFLVKSQSVTEKQKSEKIVTVRNVKLAIHSLALDLYGALEEIYDSGLVM